MTSKLHSDHLFEVREALRCAAAGDPSHMNIALDALDSLEEQLEAAQKSLFLKETRAAAWEGRARKAEEQLEALASSTRAVQSQPRDDGMAISLALRIAVALDSNTESTP